MAAKKGKGFTVKDNRGVEKTSPPSTDGALAHQQTDTEQTPDTEAEAKASEPASSSLELVEQFDPFKGGLERYAAEGRLEMRNGHVLVYAIMTGDSSSLGLEGGDKLGKGIIDTREAIAWEVRGVAPDVPESAGVEVGMAIRHLSATAAPVNGQDKSCRWYQLWYGDVTCAVWPDEQVTVEDPETGDVVTMVRPSGASAVVDGEHVQGAYPWQARQMPGSAKAWCVVDADGDVMGENISQARAEQIADRVNIKAGFQSTDSNQKIGATFTVEELPTKAAPQPIRTPAPVEDDDDALLDGLGPSQVAIMLPLITSGDLKAAKAIRPQLLAMAGHQEEVDEVVDRQQTMDISQLPPDVKKTILQVEKSLGLEQAIAYKENWEANNLEKKKPLTGQRSPSTPTTRTSRVVRRR